jgi:hypothetical protein
MIVYNTDGSRYVYAIPAYVHCPNAYRWGDGIDVTKRV